MGYKLKEREGFAEGIARVVEEQVDQAVEQLRREGDADFDAAVHDARKRLKKSRSALRLARYDVGDACRRAENEILREAGRRLAGVRDAQVQLETLTLFEDELSRPSRDAMRSLLEEKRELLSEGESPEGKESKAIAGELAALHDRIPDWPLSDESFESAQEGLRRIHKRGRDAMEVALAGGSDEDWHEWRKRVKDLWYSLRIVKPIAPTQLAGMVDEADELSDVLGDHNDLAVLLATVAERSGDLSQDQAAELRSVITRRRDRLRLAAVPLGRRLYAEGPRRFARRLATYWDVRDAEAVADARWLTRAEAEEIRGLLARKSAAAGAEQRRLGRRLREHGFKVSELGELVKAAPADFGPDEFDKLVRRGQIRIGDPPPARALA